MNKNNLYLTKDLYEASFLYAKRLKLLKLEKEDDFYWFVFEDKEKAEILSNQYWMREGEVIPKEYAEAIRTLKDLLFVRKGD
jgi:hypothetical protein